MEQNFVNTLVEFSNEESVSRDIFGVKKFNTL